MYIKEHNKHAYEAVQEQLKKTDKTCVVMPTGSGKSYVALQLIRDNEKKKILFLTSQVNALEHFKSLSIKELGHARFDVALYAGAKI